MLHGSGKGLQRNTSTKTPVLSVTIQKVTTNPAAGQFLNFQNLFLSD